MQVSDPVLLALIGMLGAIVAGFFKMIDSQDKTHLELTKSIDKMSQSSLAVAKATEKGAEEAKQRNGHLGEQNIQIAELVSKQNKDVSRILESTKVTADVLSKSAIISAEDRSILTGSGSQVIEAQVVEHQTVKEKL